MFLRSQNTCSNGSNSFSCAIQTRYDKMLLLPATQKINCARLEKAASRRNSRASLGEESKGEASGNGSVGEGKEEEGGIA